MWGNEPSDVFRAIRATIGCDWRTAKGMVDGVSQGGLT
jgi:hypothetical protein